MNFKTAVPYVLLLFLVSFSQPTYPEPLKSGEVVVFLKDGKQAVGEIADISIPGQTLTFKDGKSIPLSEVWLINTVNKGWNFKKERSQLEETTPAFILKKGKPVKGKIKSFDPAKKLIDLEKGEKLELAKVKRIYFFKSPPAKLLESLKKGKLEVTKK